MTFTYRSDDATEHQRGHGLSMPTPLIIGLGVNGWNVHRALLQGGVRALAIDNDPGSEFWAARTIERVYSSALSGSPLFETLRTICTSPGSYLLLSATEDAVKCLSENRCQLPPTLLFSLPDAGVVSMLLDKKRFYAEAVKLGAPILPMYFPETWTTVAGLESARFPCIIKTRRKMYAPGLDKAYKVSTRREVKDLLARLSQVPGLRPDDLLIQEWVDGSDSDVIFCMQYYDKGGRPRMSFVGRKIRQWRPGVGGTASAEPHEDPEALRWTTQFFGSVGMRGICSMEFKRSRQDGRLYMIEPTVGRADYQEGVAVANGCNIPLLAYLDMAGADSTRAFRNSRRAVKWVHAGNDYMAASYYISRGELTWSRYLRSLSGPKAFAIFTTTDPWPFAELLRRKLANRGRRLMGIFQQQ